MKKLFLLVAVSTLGFFSLQGCNARFSVAKDNALKKLDQMLGAMEVSRKEIDQELDGLKQGINGLTKAKVKATVKLEELNRKIEPLQKKQSDIAVTLVKYKEYLVADKPVQLAGKMVSVDTLKSNAQKLVEAQKRLNSEISNIEKSKLGVEKIVATFDAKKRELDGQMTSLQSKIAQIDAQMVAVRSLKDAKEAMGDSDATLGENIGNLQNKVDDLMAEVQVHLATEGEVFNEIAAIKQVDEIDSLVAEIKGPKDTISEIDALLNEDKK